MLAVVLSLGGVLFLLLSTGLELGGGTLVGDLLCLANATSFSIFLVLSRPIVQGLSPWVSTPIVFACGAVGVGLYGAPAVGELDWSAVPTQVWWVGAGLVLGPTVGAYFLNYWALARVESSRVALFIYLQFLLAAPLSAWLLDERLTWRLIPAAVLVFGGVALSSRPGRGAPRLGPTAPRADTASS
jgi:drug/metabolite transporter (DMT)-like permease